MVAVSEGQEVILDDEHSWAAISLVKGQVIEVNFAATNFHIQSDTWGAFFIVDVAHLPDGSMVAEVRFVGSEDPEIHEACVPIFNEGRRKLHMCLTRPCLDGSDEEKLHVTRVRVWTLPGFRSCEYIVEEMWKRVDQWSKELDSPPLVPGGGDAKPSRSRRKPVKDAVDPVPKKTRTPRTTVVAPTAKSKVKATPATTSRRSTKVRPDAEVGGGSEALTEEKKQALRDKLKKIRGVLTKGGEPPEKESSEEDAEDFELVGSSAEDSPFALEDGLKTGAGLELVKKGLEESVPLRKVALKKKTIEDTRGSTSKSLRRQLALRALEVSERKAKKKKKEKKESSSDVKKLSHMLSKILTKGSSSSSKKKRKRKRKLKNGVIETCSDSSCESTEGSEKMSSEEDLEAPVKKKSRDHPGSVLSLLTSHVRDQLEQGAAVDLPGGDGGVINGVKIVTYFNLHLKPQYGQFQRELREMFTLASTLDQLRSGDIARVGDSLAGRFIALHQFLQDGHWGTAKHMELHPLEESSAAGPSIVLASRKHAKLVQKVQGIQPAGQWGYQPGRGRGRGKGDWYGDHKGDGKGDHKGKGKGKGKGRGKWKGQEVIAGDWEKTKEKADEKK